MNRIVTCMLAGALAFSLSPAALGQDETPAAESKPVPLSGVDPADYVDLMAEGKGGDILGIVFDVVLDDSGKAKTIVLELFDGEAPAEGAAAPEGEEEMAAEDTVADEPEPLADEEGAGTEGAPEGTEEPIMVGKLIGVSPKGGMMDTGRDLIMLPSITAAQVEKMPEFAYQPGMKTVAYPDGYTEAAPAEDSEG